MKKKLFVCILLALTYSSVVYSQGYPDSDYLNPAEATITNSDELIIYGRGKITNVTEQPGLTPQLTAKLYIASKPNDPRLNAIYKIDAVYDGDYDNSDQFKATVQNIPIGEYYYGYYYRYQNDYYYFFGGVGGYIDGMFHVGKLHVTSATNISDNVNEIPTSTELSQNYPNPFNPTTTIKYSIPQSGFVTLKVYDVLGKEIFLLVDEEKQPGIYQIEFDAEKLSSGIYFYQLQYGATIINKKMLLLK